MTKTRKAHPEWVVGNDPAARVLAHNDKADATAGAEAPPATTLSVTSEWVGYYHPDAFFTFDPAAGKTFDV